MSKQSILLAAIAALALASSSAHSATADGPAFVHEGSDLKADPAVRWGRLANGVRYAIRTNAKPKGCASMQLAVKRTGSSGSRTFWNIWRSTATLTGRLARYPT